MNREFDDNTIARFLRAKGIDPMEVKEFVDCSLQAYDHALRKKSLHDSNLGDFVCNTKAACQQIMSICELNSVASRVRRLQTYLWYGNIPTPSTKRTAWSDDTIVRFLRYKEIDSCELAAFLEHSLHAFDQIMGGRLEAKAGTQEDCDQAKSILRIERIRSQVCQLITYLKLGPESTPKARRSRKSLARMA